MIAAAENSAPRTVADVQAGGTGADESMSSTDRKVLVIKAKGGLGNRMLSAITGLIYADLTDRQPVIDWRDGIYAGPGVNAYPLLFDSPKMPDPAEFDQATDTVPAVWSGQLSRHPSEMIQKNDPSRHSDPFIYRKYCIDLGTLERETETGVFWCYLPKTFRLRNHIRNSPRFRGRETDSIVSDYLKRFFTPNESVRNAVSKALSGLNEPVIGVHVRYSDRKISLDGIRKAIRGLRSRHPDAPLFLATDSAYVQETLSEEFGNLHFTEKWLPSSGQHLHLADKDRDSLVEAQNAMTDMWALASCDYLVYSKHSTFSVASALIGRIPVDRQTDIDRYNFKVVAKRIFQMVA